jgi:plasmid stability protein
MKMIQIRNVPEDLHRKLKARAAEAGLTLSDYLLREAERAAERPTIEQLTAQVRSRRRWRGSEPPSRTVRELRDTAG